MIEGWQEDHEIEELFAQKDRDLIQRLGTLFSKAKNRETKVEKITNRLYDEIKDLDRYISNMAGKIEDSEILDPESFINTIVTV